VSEQFGIMDFFLSLSFSKTSWTDQLCFFKGNIFKLLPFFSPVPFSHNDVIAIFIETLPFSLWIWIDYQILIYIHVICMYLCNMYTFEPTVLNTYIDFLESEQGGSKIPIQTRITK
jgi:hypothetical protein